MTPRFSQSPFNTYSDHSPLIYLVDNHADQTELLKQVLLDSGYRVQVFAEADMLFHTACTDSTTESPAAVVMDIIFSGDDIAASSVKGFDVCKNAGIPFLSVSVRDDLSARLAAFRMGAKHYLSKPINSDRLIEILDELTGRQQAVPYRILLVDDDQELLDFNQALFGGAGMVVRTLSEPLKTLDVVKDFAPDVVVLDVYMPDITGPELAAILRDSGFQLPILFLSVEDDIDQQIQALSQGGDDFLTKSVQADHLLATVTARAQRSRRSNAVCYRLEKNLYEREREHLALNQHAIVTIADGNGNITYANELFCQVSGYSFGELVGQNHRIVRSGLHSDEFYKEMWQTISNGNVWHGELCNRSKTGSLHWMESTITPFLDDDGKPYQYISIRTDITRNKEREHALRAIVDGTMAVSGESFIRNTVQGLADSMGLRWSFIARIDDDDESMFRTVAMWDTDQIIDNFSYPVVGTPCERVLQNGLSVYAENVAELFPEDAWLRENGIESYIGIPLFDSNGNFLGHMGVMDEKPIINVDEKINFLRIFAASVANELEREQSEKYLQASEARLNFLVNSSPVTIYTSTATPPYAATYISPNIKQLLGYEPEQFTENPNFWADNIHPDDQQQVFDNLPQLFEHGKHQHEYRFRKPDGSYVWMHDELRLIRNAAGEPIEITGYWADISNRKLTEQLLELNKERLRRGQVFANIGTWDWNIVTGELFWSERIGPLFGYQDGELETSYENFLGAVHEDDRQSVIDAVNDCVEHGIPYDIEHRVTWPDGTVRWLHERGAVVRDADGKPLQMLGVVQDIDDRKRAELALVEREQQLREAQALARIGNWKANLLTGELSWSDEIYNIFGFELGSFSPNVEAFYAAIHPDDLAGVKASEKRAEQTGHHDVIHRIVRPDGSVRHVHELAQMITDAEGQIVQLAGTVQDVTEQIEAEAILAENEEKFRSLYEQSPVGIALNEMDGSFIEANQEFLDIIGYTEQECRALTYWQLTPEEYATQEAQQLDSLNSSGHYGPYEKEYIHKDGHRVSVLLNGSIVHDRYGHKRIWSIVQDISKRKQAERAMRESEERFAFAVEGAGDGIWDWDMPTNKMQFSRMYMEMLGYTENELPHSVDTWVASVHPEDMARVQQNLQEYLQGQSPVYRVELRLRCKDGSYKWILCRGQVVETDNDGNPVRMIGIHSDITVQKLASLELNRFKMTLDMTIDCVFMFEPVSLRFFYANRGAVDQFGYDEAELMNMTPVDIKPDFDEATFRQLIKPLIEGKVELLTLDTIHQHKNGSIIPVEISLQYIEPEGETARFVAIVRNIAERKQTEAAIKESQQRMALHVQRTPLGVIEWDNNFCVTEWNTAAESIFGYTREEALGRHATEIIIPDDIFDEVDEVWEQLLTLRGGLRSNNKNLTKDGDVIFCEWYNTPLINEDEKVIGVASLVQDVTKQKHAENELIKAKVEAEYANAAKSEFLSSMSHELRTPMNSILGFSQLLQYDEDLSEEQQDNVHEILKAGHHLLNLINEVLDLAKVESGQIELSLEPVEVGHVVEECISLVATLAVKRDIQISYSDLEGAVVRADRTRLKQVLINLLSNAIKYNRDGGSVTVEVLHKEKDRLLIEIKDTGIGIADDRLNELFQPFNRLDAEDSEIEGTGIGLTITRRIVEMMGGIVGVQSTVGVGSVFWIELPLELLTRSVDGKVVHKASGQKQNTPMVHHVILYIEDNPANLKLVSQILAHRKHIKLLTAHTPEIGLELATTQLPELILLDINMPGMDGYQVLEILKADSDLKHIPVVAVTANAMLRDIEQGKAAGFTDYVTKPLEVVKFLDIVDQCLNIEESN